MILAQNSSTHSSASYWEWIAPVASFQGLSVIFAISVIVVVVAVFVRRGTCQISAATAEFFFWLDMAYLAILFAVAAIYITSLPTGSYLIGDVVPLPVLWFGALGAVTISLEGVFIFNSAWDAKYNFWHVARPIFGAVLGLVAFFMMVLILKSAGTPPKFLIAGSTKGTVEPLDFIIFYVLSFLVGYREETFRELMKRATDLILAPAKPTTEIPEITFVDNGRPISFVDFGPVPQNTTSTAKTIQVQNKSSAAAQKVIARVTPISPAGHTAFQIAGNRLDGNGNLSGAGGVETISVTFKPTSQAPYEAKLVVEGGNLAQQTILLKGQGT